MVATSVDLFRFRDFVPYSRFQGTTTSHSRGPSRLNDFDRPGQPDIQNVIYKINASACGPPFSTPLV